MTLENEVEEIYIWGLVKGSNDDEIGSCEIAKGILFITKTIDEANSLKHYIKSVKKEKITLIHEDNNDYGYDHPFDTFKDCLKKYDEESSLKDKLPPALGAELLKVALHNDPDEFMEYEDLQDELLYEESDSSYFNEISGADSETTYIGAYARAINIEKEFSLDITDKEKMEELAAKLYEDIFSLSDLTNYESFDEALDNNFIIWSGVHLVPSK